MLVLKFLGRLCPCLHKWCDLQKWPLSCLYCGVHCRTNVGVLCPYTTKVTHSSCESSKHQCAISILCPCYFVHSVLTVTSRQVGDNDNNLSDVEHWGITWWLMCECKFVEHWRVCMNLMTSATVLGTCAEGHMVAHVCMLDTMHLHWVCLLTISARWTGICAVGRTNFADPQ
eukprot:4556402-Amphidinium_carterae.3